MTGPSNRSGTSSIAEEHQQIRVLLDRITALDNPVEIQPVLLELHALLKVHFRHEEASDGLHAEVGEMAPRFAARIDHLLGEHDSFLARAQELVDQCAGIVDGPLKELQDGVRRLDESIQLHDAAETEILNEALLTDLGESG